jgi:hypothetical protein
MTMTGYLFRLKKYPFTYVQGVVLQSTVQYNIYFFSIIMSDLMTDDLFTDLKKHLNEFLEDRTAWMKSEDCNGVERCGDYYGYAKLLT